VGNPAHGSAQGHSIKDLDASPKKPAVEPQPFNPAMAAAPAPSNSKFASFRLKRRPDLRSLPAKGSSKSASLEAIWFPTPLSGRTAGEASFNSPAHASSSANRCAQLSGFHNRPIVSKSRTMAHNEAGKLLAQLLGQRQEFLIS
jgi:hypothetical protein